MRVVRLRRWWAVALAALALAALGQLRLPAEAHLDAHFPDATPHGLAHLLADFSRHPDVGRWAVEEEKSNYTSWQYRVAFECGARCEGRATVRAHEFALLPRHGHSRATRHTVAVTRIDCTRLPLLPWPRFCNEMETEARVEGVDGGARLTAEARGWCTVALALTGACSGVLEAHLANVRAALVIGGDAPRHANKY